MGVILLAEKTAEETAVTMLELSIDCGDAQNVNNLQFTKHGIDIRKWFDWPALLLAAVEGRVWLINSC